MIGPRVGAEDLRVLGGQWKANHVRWQLIWGGFPHGPADRGDLSAYDAWIDSELERLDSLLPVCEEVGILVLIDLHTPPGGRNEAKECRLFKEARFQEAFLKVWEKIAARYRDSKTVWGYDLVNEPVEGILGEGVMDWHALATEAARRIRKIDPEHAIIVEPAPWGSPERLEFFEPIDAGASLQCPHVPAAPVHAPGSTTRRSASPIRARSAAGTGTRRRSAALRPAIDYRRDYGVEITSANSARSAGRPARAPMTTSAT